eukprot:766325-Hanusia_phi.AAC.4
MTAVRAGTCGGRRSVRGGGGGEEEEKGRGEERRRRRRRRRGGEKREERRRRRGGEGRRFHLELQPSIQGDKALQVVDGEPASEQQRSISMHQRRVHDVGARRGHLLV